jgi:uncharacterized protein
MLPPDLLQVLRCPETMQPLRMGSEELLAEINERIRAGRLRNRGGRRHEELLEAVLVREDGRVAYPIWSGIPVLLAAEGIWLDPMEIKNPGSGQEPGR